MSDLTLDNLLDLERRGWDSLCNAEGGSYFGNLMTADALMILVNGWVLDRPSVIQSLNASPQWDTYAIDDVLLVPVSDTSAALVYRATAGRTGEEPFVALMSSHYCLTQDAIKLALYQQTSRTH